MPSYHRIAITCPPELQSRLREFSRQSGIPYSELVRRVLARAVREWERKGTVPPPLTEKERDK